MTTRKRRTDELDGANNYKTCAWYTGPSMNTGGEASAAPAHHAALTTELWMHIHGVMVLDLGSRDLG